MTKDNRTVRNFQHEITGLFRQVIAKVERHAEVYFPVIYSSVYIDSRLHQPDHAGGNKDETRKAVNYPLIPANLAVFR